MQAQVLSLLLLALATAVVGQSGGYPGKCNKSGGKRRLAKGILDYEDEEDYQDDDFAGPETVADYSSFEEDATSESETQSERRLVASGVFEPFCTCVICTYLEITKQDLADGMDGCSYAITQVLEVLTRLDSSTVRTVDSDNAFFAAWILLNVPEYFTIADAYNFFEDFIAPLDTEYFTDAWFAMMFPSLPRRKLLGPGVLEHPLPTSQQDAVRFLADRAIDVSFGGGAPFTDPAQILYGAFVATEIDNCFDENDDMLILQKIKTCVAPCYKNINFCQQLGHMGFQTGLTICQFADECFGENNHCHNSTDNVFGSDLLVFVPACAYFGATASGEGDPHFQLWNGMWYDFHGGCDLVLTHAPRFADGLGLDAHVRTKVRYSYSYIEAAAVRIGEDVLEVGSFGEWSLNGVDSADLRKATVGGFPLYYRQMSDIHSVFDIVVGDGQNITLRAYKDLVAFKADGVNPLHFRGSVGLLGSFDHDGAMLGRDGMTNMTEDPNVFGMEWQVRPEEPQLFRSVQAPQYPEQCIMPSVTERRRRLGEASVDKDAAEEACAHWGDKQEICAFDVMATGDLDLAQVGPF